MRYKVVGYIPHSSEVVDIVKCSNFDHADGVAKDFLSIGADAYIIDTKNNSVKMLYCE